MLPEVQAYYDAISSREYRIETDRVYRAHPVPEWNPTMTPEQVTAYFEADDARKAALHDLEKTFKRKQAEAYQKLVTSADPLVRFLVTDPEVQAYPDHARIALQALPMSREEMEEFGDRQDWCREFQRLLRRAEEAGVLPPPMPDLADIDDLVRELANSSGMEQRRLRAIVKKHVPDILASAKAKAADAQAEEGVPVTV
ncbi:hypothetical protein [Nonomuraea sp. NPDC023979]|uniref:hypothetical protein n=1 Tax=Nonomuraea sp. NPDC023979 TaxID=3154796 RepID=UPI003400BDA7